MKNNSLSLVNALDCVRSQAPTTWKDHVCIPMFLIFRIYTKLNFRKATDIKTPLLPQTLSRNHAQVPEQSYASARHHWLVNTTLNSTKHM
jgi:hypothetical protein